MSRARWLELRMGNKKSHKSAKHSDLTISECKEGTFIKGGKQGRTLILKLIQSDTFFKRPRPQGIIPKQFGSLEDKYLKRCLQLIHANSLKEVPYPVSMNLSSLETGFVSDNTLFGNKYPCDLPNFAVDYQIMAVGGRDVVSCSEDEGIMRSIVGSNNMINILSSPVFQKLGISDHNGTNLFKNKRCMPSDYQGSPGRLKSSPSQNPGKETGIRNQGYRSISVPKSLISDSRVGLGLSTDHPSSGCSTSQGMLLCTWENGIPHFTFSLDEEKELYVADAAKPEVVHEKALDYVYSFHLKANGQTLTDTRCIESDLIGKMKVSTSFSLCSGNSEVTQTEFVLAGTIDDHVREIHPLSRNHRRSRKLSRVMDMFKTGPSHKHLAPSIFDGSGASPKDFSVDRTSRPEHPENEFLPNLELAAVVVKSHVQNEDNQKEVGGWGLKFLKKSMVQNIVDSSDVSATPKCCQCKAGDCATNMDIIVPAGFHGGPRTKNDGPSSLIERWRSSGHCDCGGWDLGCPLKVFKARPRSEMGRPNSESQGGCKSFDMFIEGSEQATPTMKMVNSRDGLYFISFQSTLLSTLQCFAIAVATIHSKTPSLTPKQVHN